MLDVVTVAKRVTDTHGRVAGSLGCGGGVCVGEQTKLKSITKSK